MKALYDRARQFIYQNARPLDFARWRYHFENGSAEDVLSALAAYQNPDGGFGHGLEADALNPNSSPIQTWCATMILREVDVLDERHPIAAEILRYLTSGVHFDGHCWAWSIPTNDDYPHAPWWSYTVPDPNALPNYNPTASLAGFLLRASRQGSSARALGLLIAQEACQFYLSGKAEIEMHLLPCFLTLARDLRATVPDFPHLCELCAKLRSDVRTCVLRDADKWEDNYCALPSVLITGSNDPLYSCFPDLAGRECDFIVHTQETGGAWAIPWRWENYLDAYAVSANWWKSHSIIKNLLYLKNMDRL